MTTPAKPLDLRGRLLGGGRPLVCSPLVGRTRERLLAETAAVLAKRPDVIEWRVDYYEAIADTAAVLETGRAMRGLVGETPIIFTRRSTSRWATTRTRSARCEHRRAPPARA